MLERMREVGGIAGLAIQPVRTSSGMRGGATTCSGKHADVGGDDRPSHRLRLRDHAAEQRRLDRRHRDEVGGGECRRHVGAMPGHPEQVVHVHAPAPA